MPIRSIAIASLALLGLGASGLAYQSELDARQPVEVAIAQFELDLRRPADVEALRLQPSADLRAAIFAHMTLGDVYGRVRLRDLSGEERASWIRSLARLDEQLSTSRELTLDALVVRPGWAWHQAQIGQVEYAALRRRAIELAAGESRRWEIPLLAAMDAAPGYLPFATFLAGGYIETWEGVDPVVDRKAVIATAMREPGFVSRNYRLVGLVVSDTEAIEMLPDDAPILRIAFDREKRDKNVAAAAQLRVRIDTAERLARAFDLEKILERQRLGDKWGQRSACASWAARHRPTELDDSAAREQLAEVLALWPRNWRGRWVGDPRSRLVEHFLNGRTSSIDGEDLVSTVALLTDAPATVVARVDALAGRAWQAEQAMRSSDTLGAFEWTPVAVELARTYMAQGKNEKAASILDTVSLSALPECNVQLAIRDAAGTEVDERTSARVEELTPTHYPALLWSRSGSLSICVDPTKHRRAELIVRLHSDEPTLVSWGWDGGRVESRVVDGDSEIRTSLSDMVGRHPFGVTTEVGPRVEVVGAEVVR